VVYGMYTELSSFSAYQNQNHYGMDPLGHGTVHNYCDT